MAGQKLSFWPVHANWGNIGMTTIRDVARVAGVSISTVSLALNAPSRVSSETVRKVEAAIEQTGYAANPVARSLKRGRSNLIGMVMTDITNPFFGSLLLSIEGIAAENGYLVILSDTRGSARVEADLLALMSAHMVAGIILSPVGIYGGPPAHIFKLQMPLVLFDQQIPRARADYVGTDNELASATLCEHLVRFRHRDIAFIGGTAGLHSAEKRKEGFFRTMAQAGLPVDQDIVVDGRYAADAAYNQAVRLLTGPKRPTAIIAASNVMAIGALQALNDLSIACPQDVSLVGIDDVPWSNVIQPKITITAQPVADLARLAAQRLMARMSGTSEADLPFSDLILPPRIIMGNSTRRLG
jgi:LacI family transcriptional regulator